MQNILCPLRMQHIEIVSNKAIYAKSDKHSQNTGRCKIPPQAILLDAKNKKLDFRFFESYFFAIRFCLLYTSDAADER